MDKGFDEHDNGCSVGRPRREWLAGSTSGQQNDRIEIGLRNRTLSVPLTVNPADSGSSVSEFSRDAAAFSYTMPCDGGLYIGATKDLDAGTFFPSMIDDVRLRYCI